MVLQRQRSTAVNIENNYMNEKTEDCRHRTQSNPQSFLKILTQSNPIQSMDGSNPCPTLV